MPNFRDHFASTLQVRPLVRGRHHGAQPRFAFGDRGESHGGNVHAGIVQAAREFKRLRAFSHVNGSDGRLRRARGEAELFQAALEEFRVGPELLDQLFAFWGIEQRERRLAAWPPRKADAPWKKGKGRARWYRKSISSREPQT